MFKSVRIVALNRAIIAPRKRAIDDVFFPVRGDFATKIFRGNRATVVKIIVFHFFILFFGSGGNIVAVTPIKYIFFCQLSSGKPQIIITFYLRK